MVLGVIPGNGKTTLTVYQLLLTSRIVPLPRLILINIEKGITNMDDNARIQPIASPQTGNTQSSYVIGSQVTKLKIQIPCKTKKIRGKYVSLYKVLCYIHEHVLL